MNRSKETINGKHLRQVCDTNPTAHMLIKTFANRERTSKLTNIGKTKFNLASKGITINTKDYLDFFKKLEDQGCGAIIYGRNGKYDRFEWRYNLKTIAQAALNGTTLKVEPVVEEAPIAAEPEKVLAKNLPKWIGESTSLVFIPLRPNMNIEFELPRNITRDEVEVIKAALDRLAK